VLLHQPHCAVIETWRGHLPARPIGGPGTAVAQNTISIQYLDEIVKYRWLRLYMRMFSLSNHNYNTQRYEIHHSWETQAFGSEQGF
jgi:hypothetical protein